MLLASILSLLLLLVSAQAASPPVHILKEFQNPPFVGKPVKGAGIKGWAEKKANYLLMDFHAGQGGMGIVSNMQYKPNQAVCAKISLPSPNYSGVNVAFYSIASNGFTGRDSVQNKKRDEQDFEFLGTPKRLQLNHFVKGKGLNEVLLSVPGNTFGLCMGNTGNKIHWWVNGKLVSTKNASLGPMYSYFTMWETARGWPACCGKLVANHFLLHIHEFSIFNIVKMTDTRPTIPGSKITTTRKPASTTRKTTTTRRITTTKRPTTTKTTTRPKTTVRTTTKPKTTVRTTTKPKTTVRTTTKPKTTVRTTIKPKTTVRTTTKPNTTVRTTTKPKTTVRTTTKPKTTVRTTTKPKTTICTTTRRT
ncbi:hypothetical protein HDV05_005262 [Chytridiales sp. JEL 0842]|nr:hypothetical protein HDV05_005262 [Chytridiales sp. JEL 0842]